MMAVDAEYLHEDDRSELLSRLRKTYRYLEYEADEALLRKATTVPSRQEARRSRARSRDWRIALLIWVGLDGRTVRKRLGISEGALKEVAKALGGHEGIREWAREVFGERFGGIDALIGLQESLGGTGDVERRAELLERIGFSARAIEVEMRERRPIPTRVRNQRT